MLLLNLSRLQSYDLGSVVRGASQLNVERFEDSSANKTLEMLMICLKIDLA